MKLNVSMLRLTASESSARYSLLWSIILSHTEATLRSFGTRITYSRCASYAMTLSSNAWSEILVHKLAWTAGLFESKMHSLVEDSH